MQTVFAEHPENPNITLKLHVPRTQQQPYTGEEPSRIGLRHDEAKEGYNQDVIPLDSLQQQLVQLLKANRFPLESAWRMTNLLIVSSIIDMQNDNAKELSRVLAGEQFDQVRDAIVSTFDTWKRARIAMELPFDSKQGVEQLPKTIKDIFGKIQMPAITSLVVAMEEAYELAYSTKKPLLNRIRQALQEWFQIEYPNLVSQGYVQAGEVTQEVLNDLSTVFMVYFQSRTPPGDWIQRDASDGGGKRQRLFQDKDPAKRFSVSKGKEEEEEEEEEYFGDAEEATSFIVEPDVLSPEARLVQRIEQRLDETLRRAMYPFFNFIGELSVVLADRDTRHFYRFRNERGITVEELQGVVVPGSETLQQFFTANQKLGLPILMDIVRKEHAQWQRELQQRREEASSEDSFLGAPFNSLFPLIGARGDPPLNPVPGLDDNIVNQFEDWAMERALYVMDRNGQQELNSIFDWYYCALPYPVFWDLLSHNTVAAIEMAASDIWRWTQRRDFTIPLMIKSVDTRDIFALMVRNKYMITTGSVYSDSLTVGGGRAPSKRYLTGPGYRARDRRAAENLAGKHWWDEVILSKKEPTVEQRQQIATATRLVPIYRRILGNLEASKNLRDEPFRLRSLRGLIRSMQQDEGIISAQERAEFTNRIVRWRDINQIRKGFEVELGVAMREAHCWEAMNWELKHVGGRYGYGGSYRSRSRGFSFY